MAQYLCCASLSRYILILRSFPAKMRRTEQNSRNNNLVSTDQADAWVRNDLRSSNIPPSPHRIDQQQHQHQQQGAYDDRVVVGRTTTGNRRRNVYTQTVHYNLDGAIRPKPARVCVFAWGSARKMPEKWPPSLASVRSGREEDISTGCLSVAAEASPLPPRHITRGEAGKVKWPPNVYSPVVFFSSATRFELGAVRLCLGYNSDDMPKLMIGAGGSRGSVGRRLRFACPGTLIPSEPII